MPRADALTPFCSNPPPCVVRWCVSMPPTSAVLAAHDYPPVIGGVLTELVAAVTLLAVAEVQGSLIVRLRGDGPARLMVVECTDALGVSHRTVGCRGWPSFLTTSLADLAGGPAHARMVMTLDPKGAGPVYRGIVAIETGAVATLIEHYRDLRAAREAPAAGADGTACQNC
jgi:redox-regulated HSP33 family molecular chaperone